MNVVVAIDSFKGSMTSLEAGGAVAEGIKEVCEAEATERARFSLRSSISSSMR